MPRSVKISREELIQDLKFSVGKYKFYFVILFLSLTLLVVNSQLNYKIDSEIVRINQEKSEILAENANLKREIAVLSSPERISEIAKKQQKMKPVDYKNVKFIEVK
ncbi:MAG: cell division protein FtsL [Sulfurihydrogenibium sp.]|jgi:cell division protein FtsL|nr:cell division protein FtsL [Sulfurihydrogenibium sp.]